MNKKENRYLVFYGGGLGPNVWDAELIVDAPDIKTALEKVIDMFDMELGVYKTAG